MAQNQAGAESNRSTATVDLQLEVDPALTEAEAGTMRITSTGETVVAADAVLEQNGRTYQGHSKGTYFLPNDADEQDRLDFQHQMCLLMLDGKAGLAPVKAPEYVLDIGTGTGLWAIEFAQNNPTSNVYGSDLSTIQRKSPVDNVTFVEQDAEKETWKYAHKFDYIHLRYMVTCFEDTRVVMKKSLEQMKPGAWFEIMDLEGRLLGFDSSFEGTALEEWTRLINKAAGAVGRDMTKPRQYKGWMEELGFVDVVDKEFMSPGNPWPKDQKMKKIGAYQTPCLIGVVEGMTQLLRFSGLDQDGIDELLPRVRRDMRDTSIHWYLSMHIVYGRKPLADEKA